MNDRPDRVTIELPAWVPSLADRGVQAGAVLVALAAVGFTSLGLAWSGAAAQINVGLQMPYLASGVLGGVAVAGAGLALLSVHLERRAQAVDRLDLDAALRATATVAAALPGAMAVKRRPELVRNGATVHRAGCRAARGRGLPPLRSGDRVAGLRACGICRPQLP